LAGHLCYRDEKSVLHKAAPHFAKLHSFTAFVLICCGQNFCCLWHT